MNTPLNLCTIDEIVAEIAKRHPDGYFVAYELKKDLADHENQNWGLQLSGNDNILCKLLIHVQNAISVRVDECVEDRFNKYVPENDDEV